MWETRVQSLGQEDPLEKEWQPTPVFLPGKSHGPRSLAGYSPWGHKESDMTEQLHLQGKISCKITGTKTKGIKIGGNNLHQEKETVPETK